MPYINSIITFKLTENEKEVLKSEIAKALEVFPGKTEEWLFVGFQDNQCLYFKGDLKDRAAIIDVKIFGNQAKDLKNAFTEIICEILDVELKILKENIYVIFSEVQDGNWGWNGSLF